MKRKNRYKVLSYAKKQYSEYFGVNYEYRHLSKKALHKMLEENKHSVMCTWSYCCIGLHESCWQEPYFVGSWDMTQEDVDNAIKDAIDTTAKICRKDSRILYYEEHNVIHVIILARDVLKEDYLIAFTNDEDAQYDVFM